MLSEEEKKAVNNLNFIVVTDIYDNEVSINKTEIVNEYNHSVGIVLNLITKLQKENECYKFSVNKLNSELEEVNWKISELAKIVSQRSNIYWDKDDVLKEINKQYFETKAKKGE